ncbi:MAG: hypothetical protein M3Y44_01710 [Actinomycetota bacterium]|nr:hypothetical protein [Actinomycetota bacterium]
MTTFATYQLAAQRRQELMAQAAHHRQVRTGHAPHTLPRNGSPRSVTAQTRSAWHAWYAAGQL